jgi:hypothetical protein
MQKFLTTVAVLIVIATPAFAQSFDPDNGTGNALSLGSKPTAPKNNRITPPERNTRLRHGSAHPTPVSPLLWCR